MAPGLIGLGDSVMGVWAKSMGLLLLPLLLLFWLLGLLDELLAPLKELGAVDMVCELTPVALLCTPVEAAVLVDPWSAA